MTSLESDDADHRWRQAGRRFRATPITLGKRSDMGERMFVEGPTLHRSRTRPSRAEQNGPAEDAASRNEAVAGGWRGGGRRRHRHGPLSANARAKPGAVGAGLPGEPGPDLVSATDAVACEQVSHFQFGNEHEGVWGRA